MAFNKAKKKENYDAPKVPITWKEIKRQKFLLIWSAIFVVYGFIFYYLPLGGWITAFQHYKPKDGFLHSKFVGLLPRANVTPLSSITSAHSGMLEVSTQLP